jgi:gluconokinase
MQLAGPVAVLLVMGVSGSGKSTIGALLADRLGWLFEDADWFHPAANIEKMRAGHALTEEERAPWLAAIAARIDALRARDQCVVIACSALKRAHRAALIGARHDARLIYIAGPPELIAGRLNSRAGHFMPASLLNSQYETLEPPGADEDPIVVVSAAAPDEIVRHIVAAVGFFPGA